MRDTFIVVGEQLFYGFLGLCISSFVLAMFLSFMMWDYNLDKLLIVWRLTMGHLGFTALIGYGGFLIGCLYTKYNRKTVYALK